MKIKITDKRSGLPDGGIYDLWEPTAIVLISQKYAVEYQQDEPVEEVNENAVENNDTASDRADNISGGEVAPQSRRRRR